MLYKNDFDKNHAEEEIVCSEFQDVSLVYVQKKVSKLCMLCMSITLVCGMGAISFLWDLWGY